MLFIPMRLFLRNQPMKWVLQYLLSDSPILISEVGYLHLLSFGDEINDQHLSWTMLVNIRSEDWEKQINEEKITVFSG